MSMTVVLTPRKQPAFALKGQIARGIVHAVGLNTMNTLNEEHIPFLRGLNILATGLDHDTIAALIQALEEGQVFDLREER